VRRGFEVPSAHNRVFDPCLHDASVPAVFTFPFHPCADDLSKFDCMRRNARFKTKKRGLAFGVRFRILQN